MHMQKSKKFAVAAATALLLPVIAAPGAMAQPAHTGTTLTWFTRVGPGENPWEKAEVAGFEKLHPNIHINLITAPASGGQFDLKFNQLIQDGTPADIWSHLGQAGFADYYHRGLLANEDPLIKAVGYSFGQTPMNLVNFYRKPDGLFGIPSITLGSYLYYNKDIFDAYNKLHPNARIAYPPINWDDRTWTRTKMLEIARKLTGLTIMTSSGTTKSWGFDEGQWPPMFAAFQAGTDMFAAHDYVSGAPKTINLTDPRTVAFIQSIADTFNVSKVAEPYSRFVQIGNTGSDPFQFCDLAMFATGGWGFRDYRTIKCRWAAAAIPWAATNKAMLFTDPYMIAKTCKNPQAAMLFVQYLTNADSMTAYVRNVGFTPSNPAYLGLWYSQYAAITGMPVADLKTLVAGARKYGFESPNHLIDNYSQIDSALGPYLDKIYYGQATAAAVLPQAQAAVNAILAQQQ